MTSPDTNLRIAGAARLYPMPNRYGMNLLRWQIRDFRASFGFTPTICLVRSEDDPVVVYARHIGLEVKISDAVKPGNFMLQGAKVVG